MPFFSSLSFACEDVSPKVFEPTSFNTSSFDLRYSFIEISFRIKKDLYIVLHYAQVSFSIVKPAEHSRHAVDLTHASTHIHLRGITPSY